MSILEGLILGMIQGITEFLPISSSGHLVIAQTMFGISENNLAFDILLHAATFFAIVAAYSQTVIGMIREFFLMLRDVFTRKGAGLKENKYRRYIFYIIIGCIPAGVAGILLDDLVDSLFLQMPVVGLMLLLTGFVLCLAEKLSEHTTGEIGDLGVVKSFVVGLFQMCAIMPGLSRSGTTMTGGVVMGLKKEDALEFSFLLALPTIAGSVVLKIGDIAQAIGTISIFPCLVGFFAALVSGYLSIILFKKIVQKSGLMGFSVYCWALGLIVLLGMGRI